MIDIQNQGVTQTVSSKNGKISSNVLEWDMDYNGKRLDLDMNLNGKKKHLKLKKSDLETLLNNQRCLNMKKNRHSKTKTKIRHRSNTKSKTRRYKHKSVSVRKHKSVSNVRKHVETNTTCTPNNSKTMRIYFYKK